MGKCKLTYSAQLIVTYMTHVEYRRDITAIREMTEVAGNATNFQGRTKSLKLLFILSISQLIFTCNLRNPGLHLMCHFSLNICFPKVFENNFSFRQNPLRYLCSMIALIRGRRNLHHVRRLSGGVLPGYNIIWCHLSGNASLFKGKQLNKGCLFVLFEVTVLTI